MRIVTIYSFAEGKGIYDPCSKNANKPAIKSVTKKRKKYVWYFDWNG